MRRKTILASKSGRLQSLFSKQEKSLYTIYFLSKHDNLISIIPSQSWDLILIDMEYNFDIFSISRNEINKLTKDPIIILDKQGTENDSWCKLVNGGDKYYLIPYCESALDSQIHFILNKKNCTRTAKSSLLTFNPNKLCIGFGNKRLFLTAVEGRLFKLMYENPERVYERQYIIDHIYPDFRIVSDRTIDSHIRNLRKKVNSLGLNNNPIQAVYGMGYKYQP